MYSNGKVYRKVYFPTFAGNQKTARHLCHQAWRGSNIFEMDTYRNYPERIKQHVDDLLTSHLADKPAVFLTRDARSPTTAWTTFTPELEHGRVVRWDAKPLGPGMTPPVEFTVWCTSTEVVGERPITNHMKVYRGGKAYGLHYFGVERIGENTPQEACTRDRRSRHESRIFDISFYLDELYDPVVKKPVDKMLTEMMGNKPIYILVENPGINATYVAKFTPRREEGKVVEWEAVRDTSVETHSSADLEVFCTHTSDLGAFSEYTKITTSLKYDRYTVVRF
ncbi:uncharacterized protein LOC135828405 [Sycon ciliatum]|uniref:uncharacterized protein LOC135828405 n=1 Tax=Sycon ciliatum TaxID=27933 RepID=UPI0031F6D6AA